MVALISSMVSKLKTKQICTLYYDIIVVPDIKPDFHKAIDCVMLTSFRFQFTFISHK